MSRRNGATRAAKHSLQQLGVFLYKRMYGKEASPKEFLLQHCRLLRQSIVTRHSVLFKSLPEWLGYHPFVLYS